VQVQAYAIATLAGFRHIEHGGAAVDLAVEILFGAVVVLLLVSLGPLRGSALALATIALVALPVSVWAFQSGSYWLSIVPTTLGVIVHGWVAHVEDRRHQRRLLQALVGAEPARHLLRNLHSPLQRTAQRVVTLLVVDITGSSLLAARLDPLRLRAALNVFYEHVCSTVHGSGGIVNQFLGDGAMCLFGALSDEGAENARSAQLCAAGIVHPPGSVVAAWRDQTGEALRLRAALCRGRVTVGAFGTPTRFTFTAIGDAVNCAFAVIEAVPRRGDAGIWVAEEVLQAYDPGWPRRDSLAIPVPGHATEVRVHRVAPKEDAGDADRANDR
jgi:adenylate cyclase